ncbi:MAG: hypothetical protein HS128_20140 [Ideonella sp.]|nr:hypothetical protein [Ideonella sp.]MCC7458854.1 hypothetical protein [Nitrospira sp.]
MYREFDRPASWTRALFGAAALAVTLVIGLGLEGLADNYHRQNLAAAHAAPASVMVAQASVHP